MTLQASYSLAVLTQNIYDSNADDDSSMRWSELPKPILLTLLLSPIGVFLINELVKWMEIKLVCFPFLNTLQTELSLDVRFIRVDQLFYNNCNFDWDQIV